MINQPDSSSFSHLVRSFWLEGRIPYGLGCAWLGHGLQGQAAHQDAQQTLETAYDLGFRYFDTAPVYGETEVFLGEFVPHVPRPSIFLATKVELYLFKDDPRRVKDFVWRSLEASLRRLQTDHIDLCQIHDIENLDLVFGAELALEALLEARQQGLIRRIGMATRGHSILSAAAAHEAFDTILTYADYTPLNQSAAGLIEEAHARGKGVINANPLSHILKKLSLENLRGYESYPLYEPLRRAAESFDDFAALCQRCNLSRLQAALHFPLRNPAIDITLTGPASAAEVLSSVQALHTPIDPLFYEEWQRLHSS